ncbi:hypothetical protein [Sphingomonas kyeonggiensis]|uniref:Uncharacterized protein n=1 Tax=Sphingomonas kyeonggiensis TaxID=1268553 RepID=A0A7W6NX65_9SPHN|nr:hypothetical protein [Sphingomonas kyeonggiensis]MBB4098376.1 hypothetical protein [Sphingomonas kyeonggiensis]
MLPHKFAVTGAIFICTLLFSGILFGHHIYLDDALGVHRTLREACTALWAVLIPLWFTFETQSYAPDASEPQALRSFIGNQKAGQLVTVGLGLVVAALLGFNPNSDSSKLGENGATSIINTSPAR